jgi:hypothetical protein
MPDRRRPLRSPSKIIHSAGRSLTEPPGFRCSPLTSTSTPAGKSRVTFRKRVSGVLPMLDSIESAGIRRNGSSKTLAAIIFYSSVTAKILKPAAIPRRVSRPAFENSRCAWLLTHLLFTPAKAFPIAPWTPGATGALTAAVIASVVHNLVTVVNYRKTPKRCQAKGAARADEHAQKSNLTASCTSREGKNVRGKPKRRVPVGTVKVKGPVPAPVKPE